jgi:hypothetical protein
MLMLLPFFNVSASAFAPFASSAQGQCEILSWEQTFFVRSKTCSTHGRRSVQRAKTASRL